MDFIDSKFAIIQDPMDELIFKKVKRDCDNIQRVIEKYKGEYETVPELSEDVFLSLFQSRVRLEDEKNMASGFDMNHTLVEECLKLDDWKMLKGYTVQDEFSAAVSGEVITEELMMFYKEQEEIAEEAAQKVREAMEGYQGGGGANAKKIEASAQEEKNKTLDKLIKKKLGKVMKRATRKAAKKSQELSDIENAWGTGDGSKHKLPFREKMKIARKLEENPKLKEITKLAGRMRNVALHSRKVRISPGTSELYNVTEGDDLSRILSSEIALLGHPLTKKLFMKKLATKELMQYHLIDREGKERGPIVICIDNSGSMTGDPEIWSKAIAVGLIELAKKDNRHLIVNHFGSDGDPIQKYRFGKEEGFPPSRLIDMAEFFLGGGTSFQAPLNEARKDINNDMKDADIIFITDGICDVSDKWLKSFMEWKEEMEVRIYSFLVDYVNNDPKVLRKFSDIAMPASHLKDDNDTELDLYKMI